MRKKQDWMELSQDEIDSMPEESWKHYECGGCLCYAHSSSECICGSYDRQPAKRQPLADGTLPMTREELEEFKKLFNYEDEYKQVYIIGNSIYISVQRITNYKAILYLAERFDLTEGK